jgi:hypothetical protein
VLGGSTLDEVRAATGLPSRRAATALARLVSGDTRVRRGSRYSERQVNSILRHFHEDVASLRRSGGSVRT